MRKTLSLPVKPLISGTLAQYAKTLPAPHPLIPEPAPEPAKSRLFDPEIAQVPKRKKPGPVRQVAPGTLDIPLPAPAKGTMNRPDKSEQRNNLTFNWS